MSSLLMLMLLALQDTPAVQNSSGFWATVIWSMVIAIVMICLFIVAIVGLSEGTKRRT